VGDTLSNVPEIAALNNPRILLVFVNSKCHVCTESLPFYRRLAETHRRHQPPIMLVAVSRETLDELRNYLSTQNVPLDTLVAIPERSPFKQTVTPTLLLLDQHKQVRRVWLGKLSSTGESEVLSEVLRPSEGYPGG
jgi:hypothetical protein